MECCNHEEVPREKNMNVKSMQANTSKYVTRMTKSGADIQTECLDALKVTSAIKLFFAIK